LNLCQQTIFNKFNEKKFTITKGTRIPKSKKEVIMKTRMFFAVTITIVLAFCLSTPAVAGHKSFKTEEFSGTWCRTFSYPGTRTFLDDGRVIVEGGYAEMNVDVDDDRVSGKFYSLDWKINASPEGTGVVHTDFMLDPYAKDGTFEGKYKCCYTMEDGVRYVTVTVNGRGTGELDGLLLRVYSKFKFENSISCGAGVDWPFEGKILYLKKARRW
jgi:hypothetical protein